MDKNLTDKKVLCRLPQIIGQTEVTDEEAKANRKMGKGPRRPRPRIQPKIPVGKSTWWAGVKSGRFPKPIKLGRTTLWKMVEIDALIDADDED